MTTRHLLHTTILTGAITAKIPPWAGPTRIAPSARLAAPLPTSAFAGPPAMTVDGSATPSARRGPVPTSARARTLPAIKWPDALGD